MITPIKWTVIPVHKLNNIPKWIVSQYLINYIMKMKSKFYIAQNVSNLRKNRNMTREELSLALGFDNSYISKLEKEKINITIEKLDKIAKYFEVDTYKLIMSK